MSCMFGFSSFKDCHSQSVLRSYKRSYDCFIALSNIDDLIEVKGFLDFDYWSKGLRLKFCYEFKRIVEDQLWLLDESSFHFELDQFFSYLYRDQIDLKSQIYSYLIG